MASLRGWAPALLIAAALGLTASAAHAQTPAAKTPAAKTPGPKTPASQAPASQAALSAEKISERLCEAVGGRDLVSEVLPELAGVPQGATPAASRATVRAWTDARYKLGRQASGLYCDERIRGFKGNLYRLALVIGEYDQMRILAVAGLDPNVPDNLTGKTALDEVTELLDRRVVREEIPARPWERFNPTVSSGEKPYRRITLRLTLTYQNLREEGARLTGEGPPAPALSCAPTAADAPAPGVPFDGKLSTSGNGPTPQAIPGVTTVSARQAACLLDKFGSKVLVLAALKDPVVIPGSYDFSFAAAAGTFEDRVQFVAADDLKIFTRFGAEKDRPILVYCHHVNCRLSYNALLRIKAAGYTNLYWLRSGLQAWTEAGYPTAGLIATHKPLRPFEKH